MNTHTQNETIEERHVIKTVSMYPEQWAIVDEINEQLDFRSMSHALRFVVNEYRRMKIQSELQTN